jgi:hypothetical protein
MKHLPLSLTAAIMAIALVGCADNGAGTSSRVGAPLTAPYEGSTAGVLEQNTGGANSGAPNDPREFRDPNQPAGSNEGGSGNGTGSGSSGGSGAGGAAGSGSGGSGGAGSGAGSSGSGSSGGAGSGGASGSGSGGSGGAGGAK